MTPSPSCDILVETIRKGGEKRGNANCVIDYFEGGLMDYKVIAAALAGLLHDVGKLEQRAQVDSWKLPDGIDKEGQPAHAAWTQYFIQHYVPKQWQGIAFAGAYHHHPEKSPASDKSLGELVALADKLSAGERADLSDQSQKPPRQMVTIFDRLSLEKSPKLRAENFLPLRALQLREDTLFPGRQVTKEKEGNEYAELVNGLRKAAKEDTPNGEAYLENLLNALQRYTWCVPSAYYHSVPDVSLYDHLRMTAALAVCMAERSPEDIHVLLDLVTKKFHTDTFSDKRLEEPLALLVGGDISGIQQFIYTISAKGAAKTLRGRSFYLQLLTEAALRFTLRKLDLPYTNVIYSGGGHFFLLAPLSAADKMPGIQREITNILLRHHGTSLYLALGSAKVPAGGFASGKFPAYWSEMHRELVAQKQRRFSELGDQMHASVFAPPEFGGNPDLACAVCGEDHRKTQIWNELESQDRICSLCFSFSKQLGGKLPTTQFVALGIGEAARQSNETALDVLAEFGVKVQLLTAADEDVKLTGEQIVIWALDDPENDRWPSVNNAAPVHAIRYTANHVPEQSFDELQEKVGGGFKRLGVLRMDVDDLGKFFKSGFGPYATLARLASLSFQSSLFFEGWLKRLCANENIYTVYSGGDDVFLIGPWDIMPELAQMIVKDFKRFTGGHTGLHISAGMAFIGGKYPVYQAADDAKETLEKAKALDGKDAFSYLDTAWKWSVFSDVADKQKRIENLVTPKEKGGLGGPHSLTQILRRLSADAELHSHGRSRRAWGHWIWMGMYLMTRMMEQNKGIAPELKAIQESLSSADYKNLNQWGTAARWTQLKTRK